MTNPFDTGPNEAGEYDAWYDSPSGGSVLRAEERCVRELLAGAPRPWLEGGAGSGRFGGDLGADAGLDPALELLRIAALRMPSVLLGVAEALPFRDASVGAVLIVTVLEFLADPRRAIHEVARVLRPDGRLVAGFIPRGGTWGVAYAHQARDPASVFRSARFYSIEEVMSLVADAGLRHTGTRAALFDPPGEAQSSRVAEVASPEAGFIALAFAPQHGSGGDAND